MWDPFGLPPVPRSLLADDDFIDNVPKSDASSSSSGGVSSAFEQELFALATNFLLYVSLGIVMWFVCWIYFPWTVRGGWRGGGGVHDDGYDMQPLNPSDEEEAGGAVEITSAHVSSSSSSSKKNNNTTADLLGLSDSGPASHPPPKTNAKVKNRIALFEDSDSDSDTGGPSASSSSPFLGPSVPPSPKSFVPASLNHSRPSLPPLQSDAPHLVFRRLVLCATGLILTFVTWGVLQERMLTRRYPRTTGDRFEYVYFLVFSNRLWSLMFSSFLLYRQSGGKGRGWIQGLNIMDLTYSACSNLLSSWCQYQSLHYVTFPVQTLFKSFKVLPVMVMGQFLMGKRYESYEYVVSLVIAVGLAVFLGASEDLNLGFGERQLAGVGLLALFLTFDSFTGQWQSRLFKRHSSLTVVDMLFFSNLVSTVLSLVTLVHENELDPALEFVWKHQEIHMHFFLFSLCSTLGQLLIFYTIRQFGAVVFAIIMTFRVLFSIIASCVLYNHPITFTGATGMIIVVGAVGYRTARKAGEGGLVRFKDRGELGREVMGSWHENLDM